MTAVQTVDGKIHKIVQDENDKKVDDDIIHISQLEKTSALLTQLLCLTYSNKIHCDARMKISEHIFFDDKEWSLFNNRFSFSETIDEDDDNLNQSQSQQLTKVHALCDNLCFKQQQLNYNYVSTIENALTEICAGFSFWFANSNYSNYSNSNSNSNSNLRMRLRRIPLIYFSGIDSEFPLYLSIGRYEHLIRKIKRHKFDYDWLAFQKCIYPLSKCRIVMPYFNPCLGWISLNEYFQLKIHKSKHQLFGKFENLISVFQSLIIQLNRLHLNEWLHNDIKPENILIHEYQNQNQSQFELQLIDFGYALYCCNSNTEQNEEKCVILDQKHRRGTRNYIAYEIICQNRYSPKSDLFSLASIILIFVAHIYPSNQSNEYPESEWHPFTDEIKIKLKFCISLGFISKEFAELLIDCLASNPHCRPTLHETYTRLDHIRQTHSLQLQEQQQQQQLRVQSVPNGCYFVQDQIDADYDFEDEDEQFEDVQN